MVDQTLVTSGFDIEVLLSERYLRDALLAQIEAGRLQLELDVAEPDDALDASITIHPPTDYERLYSPDPAASLPPAAEGSFDTRLLFGDPDGANLQLSVIADIEDNLGGQSRDGVAVGLMLAIGLTSDADDLGLERNHRLTVSLVKLDPLTQALLTFAGLPVSTVTAGIKAQLDRSIPFGVANGQRLQRAVIDLRQGGNGRPPAFGVYLNLALKADEASDAFVADRGDMTAAQNFLDAGRDLAFGTSPQLFGLLGPDTFFRLAEEDPEGSGQFRHPLREVPGDRDSEEIGRLISVTIGPEFAGIVGPPTGRLLIDVHGEYTLEVLPDPDFHLFITLRPLIEDGLLRWEADASVDVGILGSVLSVVALIGVTALMSVGAGVTLFLILLAADLITDAVASAIAAGRADELADASFLDALPHRVAVAQRRWDPLYDTRHQVVALLDRFDVNQLGLAFDGVAVLDKEPAAVAHVVIRDEERGGDGAPSGLHYRVRDRASIGADLAAVAPGTDRLPYADVDPTVDAWGEHNLVALTLGQVEDRIAARRLLAPILYFPQRIHLERHTIKQLLVVSQQETDELRTAMINAFRSQTDAAIRADQGAQLADEETDRLREELGREPTQDEIDEAVDARVRALVDEAQAVYEEDHLPADLAAAVAQILRFDLVPNEFASLQDGGVLAIAGKEIIRMRSGTVYYRDHPDFVFADNLLALPHYGLPYVPPV